MANKTAKHSKKIKDPNERKLVGKKVLYVGGGKGVFMQCPVCPRKIHKGMVSQHNGKFYCSEDCVLKVANG